MQMTSLMSSHWCLATEWPKWTRRGVCAPPSRPLAPEKQVMLLGSLKFTARTASPELQSGLQEGGVGLAPTQLKGLSQTPQGE